MSRRLFTGALGVLAAALLAGPASAAADSCRGAGEPVTAGSVAESERALLCLVNVHRAANALPALTHHPVLQRVARAHSEDMVARDFFDHENPDGAGPQDRAAAAGYPGGVGENIAYSGFPGSSALDLFRVWQASPGHNQNMLYPAYETSGMGFAIGNGLTGTQVFGLRNDGATDTAVDLLVTGKCATAKEKLAKAKRKQRKARKRVEQADGNRQEQRAKRKLRKAKRKLKAAREAKRAACNPSSF